MVNEYYQFNIEDLQRFISSQHIRTHYNRDEIVFRECPYCHSKKDKDTFSVNSKTGQFSCKRASCGAKGNMITLAKDFDLDLGTDVSRYYKINYKEQYRKFKARDLRTEDKAINYLFKRGISAEVAKRYFVTVKKDTENILVFPFLDTNKELVTIKYRKMDFDKSRDKNKEWFEANCKPILFGMYQCENYDKLIITEGQIDSLSVAEAGYKNAVSVPNGANGFSWVPFCWDFVSKFTEIVIFGDCEDGKITLVENIKQKFSRSNIKVVRIKDYKDCKDANEILQKYGKEAIVQAIENAEQIASDRIKRMSDVEAVDVENTPSVSTGIKELDKTMSGGFRKGELIIVTGKRGDGKSTFVSQLICNALENPETKAFIYSGEMIDINVKRWIDMQLAGRKEIQNSIIDKLNKWYHDRLFLYDNTAINENEDIEVIKYAEEAVSKYGCNFIVIDNLMTALDTGNNDIYRMQSVFAKKCAALAKKTESIIVLISHPRKGGGDQFDNDFVSGSADITNAANYVFCYQRYKNCSPEQRMLTVNKNRLTGKLRTNDNAIYLKYSADSKRIIQQDEDFEYVSYSWQNEELHSFTEIKENEEIPF